ncbi:hypothetical protein [Mesobacterium pallidum]|uniref:hypothetical protein n=1 Tax=Mesobacterium pallidum TaxID=2872037 RepID=UPI001EE2D57A|nr:hypothetical protein [Mesobacterium pallidum]
MADIDGGGPYDDLPALSLDAGGPADQVRVVEIDGGAPLNDPATTGVNATLPISDLRRFVEPSTPSAPITLIDQAIKQAAIDFCMETRCWRYVAIHPVLTQDGAIFIPDHAMIHEIEDAIWLDGNIPLLPTQYTDADPSMLAEDGAGVPRYITQISPNTLAVMPYAVGNVRISLFLKPTSERRFVSGGAEAITDQFGVLPRFLVLSHSTELMHGALAILYNTKSLIDVYDPKMAEYHRALFQRLKDAKHRQSVSGQQRAPVRSRTQWC